MNKETINRVLETALACGGDFAEVFIEDKFNTVIVKDNDTVDNGTVSRDYGIGIRVIKGDSCVYTYTSDDREENLLKITKEACCLFDSHP